MSNQPAQAEQKPRRLPLFQMDLGLLEPEQTSAWYLEGALHELQGFTDKFYAALQLFDFSLSQTRKLLQANKSHVPESRILASWRLIACRDGAMTLYHFAKCLGGIRGRLNEVPTLQPQIQHGELRTAEKLFESQFPDFEEMRNAVAHIAELTKNQQAVDRNAFSGNHTSAALSIKGAQNLTLTEVLEGRRFSLTIEGQIVHYEISLDTHQKLLRIEERAISAFSTLLDQRF